MNPALEISTQTILTVGGAIATALIGALTLLWNIVVKYHTKTETLLDDCETDRKAIHEKLVDVTGKVNKLEGRMEERDRLLELSESVLAKATKPPEK